MSGHHVWLGRFQPFHNGHLLFLRLVLDRTSEPVAIGVLSANGAPGQPPGPGDSRLTSANNPLTAYERRQIIEAVIAAEALEDRVDVITLPRTDMYWDIARDMLPATRTMILAEGRAGQEAEFEQAKAERYRSRGERVILLQAPDAGGVSGSIVRARLARNQDVAHLVHHTTLAFLAGGPFQSDEVD